MERRVAIFASGQGSNAHRLLEHFADHATVSVALLVSDNASAGALRHAHGAGVASLVVPRRGLGMPGLLGVLRLYRVDFIVLAGFLSLVPPELVSAYRGRMVNLHPALLPKYGGKGMYGQRVHEAVLAAGETQSGITIHWVNERYDEGDAVHQAVCPVYPGDTPDGLAARIHALEHEWLPRVTERLVLATGNGA